MFQTIRRPIKQVGSILSLFVARGVRGIDVKVVSLDFTGFAGLHLIYLLDLKGQNAYTGTYRGGILGLSLSLKNWQV